jgi:hypothetical protein
MIITNGNVVTSTKQPEDLEDLQAFIGDLAKEHTLIFELIQLPGESGTAIEAYRIPEQLSLKDIINAGAEHRSFNGIDVIEKIGSTFVNAQYQFTPEELKTLSSQMAEKIQEMAQLEDEKKEVMSQFKAKIDECNAVTRRLASNNISGYEYRDLEVVTIFDFKAKKRYYKSIETGKIVKEENMFASDFQLVFNF